MRAAFLWLQATEARDRFRQEQDIDLLNQSLDLFAAAAAAEGIPEEGSADYAFFLMDWATAWDLCFEVTDNLTDSDRALACYVQAEAQRPAVYGRLPPACRSAL